MQFQGLGFQGVVAFLALLRRAAVSAMPWGLSRCAGRYPADLVRVFNVRGTVPLP